MQTLSFKLKKIKGCGLKMVFCEGNKFCNSKRIYKEYCQIYVQCTSFPCNVTNYQTVIEEMTECDVIQCYHVYPPKPVDPDNDSIKIAAGVVSGLLILVVGVLLYYKIKSCKARQNDQPPQEEQIQDKPSLIRRIYLSLTDNTVYYILKTLCLFLIWIIGIIWIYKQNRKRWRKFKGYK